VQPAPIPCPHPQELALTGATGSLRADVAVESDDARAAAVVRRALARGPAAAPRSAPAPPGAPAAGGDGRVVLRLGRPAGRADRPADDEAYALDVDAAGARVVARTPVGLFRGATTLAQLLRDAAPVPGGFALPSLAVRDWPDFARRGAMLDVSRCRVPRMETLFELVELFASLKLNELQLYTEHAFAYRGHETVWRGVDPLTGDEVDALRRHAAERCLELVPNQQSFGHMHRWLRHAAYRDLAECPDGVEHPFALEPEPFSLCPTDPRSLRLLADLYDQLLPHFDGELVNVGLDETFDLGLGRSRAACEARGKRAVYLEHLRSVHGLVGARGRRMQFWADVVLAGVRPDGALGLPADAVPLLWGYEADHPFERQAATVAASGLAFYVCPGTSSWQSVGGRTTNALGNVRRAAAAGRAHGARGLLVTDWGDRGHLQPLLASLPGWCVAAARAWNAGDEGGRGAGGSLEPDELAARLDRRVLDAWGASSRAETARGVDGEGGPGGEGGVDGLGAFALELGRAGEATGLAVPNASPLSLLLTSVATPPAADPRLADLTVEGLERAAAHLDACARRLPSGSHPAAAPRGDPRSFADEGRAALDLLAFATRLGRARLTAAPGAPLAALDPAVRAALADELRLRLEDHRRLWVRRSRPGGLDESLAWLRRVLDALLAGN